MSSTPSPFPMIRHRGNRLADDERERLHVLSSRTWALADLLDDEHRHALAAAARNVAAELHGLATRRGGAMAD